MFRKNTPKCSKILKLSSKKEESKYKCSLDKRTMILQFLPLSPTKFCYLTVFLPIYNNFLERNCLDKPALNNISIINHSSSMNNTVTNKTKLFPQLFASGPQIALKKSHYILSWLITTTKLDIYICKYKDDYISKGLLQPISLVKINI